MARPSALSVMMLAAVVSMVASEVKVRSRLAALRDVEAQVLTVDGRYAIPPNEGRLVHLIGAMAPEKEMVDPDLGIKYDALLICRHVYVYRRLESRRPTGGVNPRMSVQYDEQWIERPMQRSPRAASGRVLNSICLEAPFRIGGFRADVTPSDVLGQPRSVVFLKDDLDALPRAWSDLQLDEGALIRGSDPDDPRPGDLFIMLSAINPADVSVIARQQGDQLVPWEHPGGSSVFLIVPGPVDSRTMLDDARVELTASRDLLRMLAGAMLTLGFFHRRRKTALP